MRLTFTAVSASAVAARHSTALLMTRAAASPMDIMGHWSDSAERTQIHIHIVKLLPRDMRKRGLCSRLSRSCIVSRRLKISSNFFLGPVAPSF